MARFYLTTMVWHGIVWQGLKRQDAITQNYMKRAKVKFIGMQEGFGTMPSFGLYTILWLSQPSMVLAVGSTVTLATIKQAGFMPEIVNRESTVLKVGAL